MPLRSIDRRWLLACALLCCVFAVRVLAVCTVDLGPFGTRAAAERTVESLTGGDADDGLRWVPPPANHRARYGETAVGFVPLVWKTAGDPRPLALAT